MQCCGLRGGGTAHSAGAAGPPLCPYPSITAPARHLFSTLGCVWRGGPAGGIVRPVGNKAVNAIVLAGGQGRRMGGMAKAFLRLGDATFIDRILSVLVPLFEELIIVAGDPRPFARLGVRVVSDERDGMGPLMGLYTGLKASGAERNFVTSADAPLLQPQLVRRLVDESDGFDALVPSWERGVEPLCAVYANSCVPAIGKVLEQRRIIAFFPLVRVRVVPEETVRQVDPRGLSFLNVNTREDYERLLRIFEGMSRGL